jgi:hypothetical protein
MELEVQLAQGTAAYTTQASRFLGLAGPVNARAGEHFLSSQLLNSILFFLTFKFQYFVLYDAYDDSNA